MEHKKIQWPGWETVRVIGHGSFGAVYEIQREIRGRIEHAALKVITIPQRADEIYNLKAEGYDDESLTQYFTDSKEQIEGEYAVMADMKGHSNIVYCDDILSVQHEEGFGWDIYIKMELLTPLKTHLTETVSDDAVIKLGSDISNALVFCEKQHILHRDIKPENIFIARDGNYKLGDFGIAKTMEGTMGGTQIGTFDYMAPEIRNNKPYGSKADIYSLGIVIYWLLNDFNIPFLTPASKRPTPSEKAAARERRFAGEQIPPPKYGSDALKAIVLKACAYDPKDRYANAQEMMDALNALRYGAVQTRTPVLHPESVISPEEVQKEIIETVPVKTVADDPVEITEELEAPSEPEPEENPWELQEDFEEEQTEEICAEELEETEQEKPKKRGKFWWKIAIPAALAVLIIVGLSIGLGGNTTDGEVVYHVPQTTIGVKTNIGGQMSNRYFVFYEPLENCYHATFDVTLPDTYSYKCEMTLYIRNDGYWEAVDSFYMDGSRTAFDVEFDDPVDFDAFAFVGPGNELISAKIYSARVIKNEEKETLTPEASDEIDSTTDSAENTNVPSNITMEQQTATEELTISESSLYFSRVGDFAKLSANKADVQWSTNAPDVVSVSNTGHVIALNGGAAEVYAKYNDIMKVCLVTVDSYVPTEEEITEAKRQLQIIEDYEAQYTTYTYSEVQAMYDELINDGDTVLSYNDAMIKKLDNAEVYYSYRGWYYYLTVYYYDSSGRLVYQDEYCVRNENLNTDDPTYSDWFVAHVHNQLFTIVTENSRYYSYHDPRGGAFSWMHYEMEYADGVASRMLIIADYLS